MSGDVVTIAKGKVSTPATLMLVAGIIMFLSQVINIGMLATGQDLSGQINQIILDMVPKNNPERKKLEEEIAKQKDRDRTVEYIVAAVFNVVGLIMNALVVMAGLRMKTLSSYTICLLGAAAAIVPLNSCCCIGFPVGIWAVIALINADVKAAFKVVAGQGQPSNDQAGWSDDPERT